MPFVILLEKIVTRFIAKTLYLLLCILKTKKVLNFTVAVMNFDKKSEFSSFLFKKDCKVSGEVFLNEELLQNHARIVMESLSAAVECLHDSKQLTALLIEIVERHDMYGVKPHIILIQVWCL